MDILDEIRAFNRFYTREIGVLGRSYLGTGLGLGEVRILFELGQGGVTGARDLAMRLALDEGYLSRVLRGFERRGWLIRAPSATDARRRDLHLTAAGRAVFAPLVERSRAALETRIAGLGAVARADLAAAAGTMRAVLGDPALAEMPVDYRDMACGDAGWLIERHGVRYAADEGFDRSFEALVAEILAAFLRGHDPARERAFIAWQGGRRVGSIFCMKGEGDAAKLRLFFLEPDLRGRGVGRALLARCLDFARAAGYGRMTLWTHESHAAACALYQRAGFRMTARSPKTSFGKDVVEQAWEIDL